MDELTAHLDRGWDLAQHGDARGAEAAARRALELDPQSAEVHNLLGFVAAMNGEAEEAVDFYRTALSLDESYFDAMLNAAEVLLHPLGRLEEAMEMCDEALSWAETDEEVADALLLKIDALLVQHADDEARHALALLPDGPLPGERYDFPIGRAHYEVGNLDRAEEYIERVIRRDPSFADAYYYQGLLREARGDYLGATSAFLRVRLLDAEVPAMAHALSKEVFETTAKQAMQALDSALRRFVEHSELFITELPGLEVIADGVDPRAMLLLDGIPTPDRPGPPCARVFIYQRNVERIVATPADLLEELIGCFESEITATFLEDRRERSPSKSELN